MTLDAIRDYCLALPHVTEKVQWGNDLLFCIGGKMFAVAALDAASPVKLSFKCTEEKFVELVEQEEIIPAPYLARHHWVGLQSDDTLSAKELKPLLKEAYQLVLVKLPKKTQAALGQDSLSEPQTKPKARQAKRRK